MASASLYNKWRPRTFAEPGDQPLVGQEHVTRTLRNAVAGGQVSHAYLFCGPRGTGKTSAARILARAVNCRRGLSGEPCNQCENCQALLSGRQLDLLIEIDGASNRGVDDVRQLRERMMQRPGGGDLTGRFKVYIIDEVHMLTQEAFNALLKSLEEPPAHVIFILATTDPQKVPATVASRCQRFDFKPVPLELLVRHLAHVATQEGVRLEPGAAELLARAAAGGMRDAVSMLDQALAFAGASRLHDADTAPDLVTAAQVQAMLGMTDFDAVSRLVDAVLDGDLPVGLRLVHEIASRGADLRQFTRQILEFLRAMLLISSDAGSILRLDDETQEAIRQRSTRTALAQIVRLIKLFSQAELGLKSPSTQPQLPLELAVVEASLTPQQSVDSGALSEPQRSSTAFPPIAQPAAVAPRSAPAPAAAERATSPQTPEDHDQAWPAEPPAGAPQRSRAATPGGGAPPHASQADAVPPVWPAQTASPSANPAPASEAGGIWPAAASRPATPVAPATWEVVGAPRERAADPAEERSAPPNGSNPNADKRSVTIQRVQQQWPAVLEGVRQSSRTLETLLRDLATLVSVDDGNVVVLQFRYAVHCGKVSEGPNLIVVQKALSRALGLPCKVRCVVAEGALGKSERARAPASQDDPIVSKALKIWRAHILTPAEVRDLEALPDFPPGDVALSGTYRPVAD